MTACVARQAHRGERPVYAAQVQARFGDPGLDGFPGQAAAFCAVLVYQGGVVRYPGALQPLGGCRPIPAAQTDLAPKGALGF